MTSAFTTPPTLRFGCSGDAVLTLQARLNLAFPRERLLAVDGIFGLLTQQSVVKFQKSRNLVPDGVVEPLTWGALFAIATAINPKPVLQFSCDNCNPAHQAFGERVAANLPSALSSGKTDTAPSGGITVGGVTIYPLRGSRYEATARGVYGGSLQYDRIFFSSAQGLQNRAFTVAIPLVPLPPLLPNNLPHIQVMNIGANPNDNTLIHELGHVWQSQHHPLPKQFMENCVACQAAALLVNRKIGRTDESVRSHPSYPENYPYSAYAYERGKSFGDYGGEQIAKQIEKGEAPIRDHVIGIAAGANDSDNKTSLATTNIRIEDRRLPTVVL